MVECGRVGTLVPGGRRGAGVVSTPRVDGSSPRARSVSVVIVNKDDARIDATLAALASQHDPRISEVLVVDASDHRLDGVAARYPDVRWIAYEHPAKKARTIAEQRNVGVREATGDVIVFLDANCIPDDGWATELTDRVLAGAESVVVGRVAS